MISPVKRAGDRSNVLKMSFLIVTVWFAFGLRLLYVHRISPFVDEYISILAMQSTLEQGIPVLPSGLFYGPKALLHSYIGVMAFGLFGQSEFAARFPSVLIGVVTVCCIYKVGREWFSPIVGLLAAVAFVWLPAAVEWGGRARMYGLLQFLVLIGVYLVINGYLRNYNRRTRAIGILIMLLAAVFVHTSAFAVIGGLAAGIVISWLIAFSKPKPNSFPSSGEVVASIIFIIIVIVFNPVMGRSWGPQIGLGDLARGNVIIQERIPYLLAFTHQFVTWPLWPLTISYVIGFISLLLRLRRKSLIFGDEIALSLFILILCTWFVTSIFAEFHEDRYLFSILPFFLVLALRELYLLTIAILTSVKLPFLRPNNFGVSIILSVFIVVLFAPGIIQLVDDDPYGFVPAYLHVQNHWRAGDVVATCSPAPSQLVLGHTDYYVIQYGAESNNDADVWTGAPLIDTPKEFETVLENNPRVWFVVEKLCWERHFDADFEEVVYQNMQTTFDRKGMLVFVSNFDWAK